LFFKNYRKIQKPRVFIQERWIYDSQRWEIKCEEELIHKMRRECEVCECIVSSYIVFHFRKVIHFGNKKKIFFEIEQFFVSISSEWSSNKRSNFQSLTDNSIHELFLLSPSPSPSLSLSLSHILFILIFICKNSTFSGFMRKFLLKSSS
jgi:hypothetical protein